MITSFKSGFVIRVFRSTRYNSPFKAISNSSSAQYRYDGLYKVKLARLQSGSYFFHLERVVAGTGRNENVETTTSFIQLCIQNETMLPSSIVESAKSDSSGKPNNFVIPKTSEKEVEVSNQTEINEIGTIRVL